MWWLASVALAATPTPRSVDFLRVDDTTSVRRYNRITGRPATGRGRDSKGKYEAWVFRDGQIERVREWNGRRLVAESQYDAVGDPWATVDFGDAAPTEVVVHGRTDTTVAVGAWHAAPFGAVALRLPPVTSRDDGTLVADVAGGGQWRAAWAPADDVFADAFRDGLSAGCACDVVDRYTVFADGRAGAGYLIAIPGLAAPRLGEVWAFPDPSGTLVLTYSAPTTAGPVGVDDPAVRLAPGRAIVALLKWNAK